MLVRLDNWRSRLDAYFDRVRTRGFDWGRHDCALFAAGAVEAMTAVDPARDWRGRYQTPARALRVLREEGHADVRSLIATLLPSVAPARADVGDIAVVAGIGTLAGLGIVVGPFIAAPAAVGLGMVLRSEMVAAFHVPFSGEVI